METISLTKRAQALVRCGAEKKTANCQLLYGADVDIIILVSEEGDYQAVAVEGDLKRGSWMMVLNCACAAFCPSCAIDGLLEASARELLDRSSATGTVVPFAADDIQRETSSRGIGIDMCDKSQSSIETPATQVSAFEIIAAEPECLPNEPVAESDDFECFLAKDYDLEPAVDDYPKVPPAAELTAPQCHPAEVCDLEVVSICSPKRHVAAPDPLENPREEPVDGPASVECSLEVSLTEPTLFDNPFDRFLPGEALKNNKKSKNGKSRKAVKKNDKQKQKKEGSVSAPQVEQLNIEAVAENPFLERRISSQEDIAAEDMGTKTVQKPSVEILDETPIEVINQTADHGCSSIISRHMVVLKILYSSKEFSCTLHKMVNLAENTKAAILEAATSYVGQKLHLDDTWQPEMIISQGVGRLGDIDVSALEESRWPEYLAYFCQYTIIPELTIEISA
ncbi:MAG: hypothetical protein M1818_002783 [Claussenomyces sp. TS43310]|nr:MAG: hypothetical protein M1818_002783 [Claussenomyces sp. TS43310]